MRSKETTREASSTFSFMVSALSCASFSMEWRYTVSDVRLMQCATKYISQVVKNWRMGNKISKDEHKNS